MAGYTSTPRQYGEYIQPYNIDLIAKALSYKQNKYDVADAQLRQEINQIGSLDIMKGVDKSYLLSRLTNMVGDINNLGALDLSDSGIVKNLDNHISQSVDNNVLNAFESTKQYRAFQQSIDDLREKNPKLYSSVNEAYALQPVNEYMKSSKVGEKLSSFGSLTYTPYQDIDDDLTKTAMEMVKNMKDGKIKIPNPNDPRYMIEKDVNGMSFEQIKSYVGSMMGNKYDAQLRINNWQRYQGYSPMGMESYKQDVEKLIQVKSDEYDKQLVEAKAELTSLTDKGEDKTAIKDKIQQLTIAKNDLGNLKTNMLKNPNYAGGMLEREFTIDRMANMLFPILKKTPDSVVGKNEVYYADLENEYKQNQLKIEEQKLDLARKKDKREDIELQIKLNGKVDKYGNPIPGDSPYSPTITPGTSDQLPDLDKVEDQTLDLISGLNDTLKANTKVTFDYISSECSKGNSSACSIISTYDSQRGDKHNGALFRQIYLKMAKDQGLVSIYDSKGNHLFNKSDLETNLVDYNNASNSYLKIKDEFFFKNYNSADLYKNIADEDKIEVATPDGLYNLKDLMIRRGLMDKNGKKLKDITSDPMVKNTINANILLGNMTVTYSGVIPSANQRMFLDKNLAELSTIYKEDLSFIRNNNGIATLEQIKKNAPRLYSAIKNYEKGKEPTDNDIYSYAPFNIGTNKRVIQDSVFRNLDPDAVDSDIKRGFYQALQNNLPNIKVYNNVSFSSKEQLENPIAKVLISQAIGSPDSPLHEYTNEDIKAVHFNMKDLNSGKNKIEVSFTVPNKILGIKDGKNTIIPVNLDLESINRENPNFSKYISDRDRNKTYTNQALSGKPIPTSSDGISFYNPSHNFEQVARISDNVQNLFRESSSYPAIVSGLTKDGATKYLTSKLSYKDSSNSVFYSDIFNRSDIDDNTRLKLLNDRQKMYIDKVKQTLNNSNNLILQAKFINDYKFSISLKDKKGNTLSGTIHDGDNLDNIHKLFSDYESSALTVFLDDAIDNERSNLIQGASDFSQDFKKLFNIQ